MIMAINSKGYSTIAALLATALFLSGCKPVERFINETFNKGTITGLNACLAYTRDDLLSEEAARRHCASRFTEEIVNFNEAIEAEAILQGSALNARIKNTTSRYVIESLGYALALKNSQGKSKQFYAREDGLWVEPSSAHERRIDFVDARSWNTPENCAKGDCWDWSITRARGFRLE